MMWIQALHKAIQYMEEHLLEEISCADIARQVHISEYEFQRAFSFLTGMTANTYIRNRRLSLAGREIVETDATVTDIAFKYGYETPESFTKAFTRFHGIAPKFAREESAKIRLFNPINIKITVEGGRSMDYRIVQTEEKKFLCVVRDFANDIINEEGNREVPDFWDEMNEKNRIDPICGLRPEGKRDLYGLCAPTKEGEETFEYGIGILVDGETADFDFEKMKKDGYCIRSVKPGTYAVFECIGEEADCISETWERFYKEFLPQMGYEAAEEPDYEIYYEKGREGLFCELWIPVKKK